MELRKNLTFHVARHSFATLVFSYDIPIVDISKMLGHKDIKVTQIYAKVMNKASQTLVQADVILTEKIYGL